MRKILIFALSAMMVLTLASCKRSYKVQKKVNGQPVPYFSWSWTGENDPWGICDLEGNEIIPRVYPKSVFFSGTYFVADSLTKKVLFSQEGKRLFEAKNIEQTGLKHFWLCTDNEGKQCVYNAIQKKPIGKYDAMKPFVCGKDVMIQAKTGDQLLLLDSKGNTIVSGHKAYILVKEGSDKGYLLAYDGKMYYKYNTAGKQIGKLTAGQWQTAKKKLGSSVVEL